MTDEDRDGDGPKLPGTKVTKALQDAGEEALEQQAELFSQFLRRSGDLPKPDAVGSEKGSEGLTDRLTDFGSEVGAFKARVQTSGRISIPDAEREALDIGEEDLVQVFVVPVDRDSDNDNKE